MDGFAAQRSLERSNSMLGDKLAQIAKDFSRAQTPEEANRLAITFHATVVDAAGSPRINALLRAMSALVPGNFYTLVPQATELQRPRFTAIARATKRGDGDGAAAEYRKMMQGVAREAVVLFRERGLFV